MESQTDSSVDPAYEFIDAPRGGSLQELNSDNHDQWFDKLAHENFNQQPTFEELQSEHEEVPVSSIKRKRSLEEEEESKKLEEVFQDYTSSATNFLQQQEEEQHHEGEEYGAYEENAHDDELSEVDERPSSHYSYRSHASNFNRTNGSFRVVQERPLKLTVPRSPNLLTATRAKHHYEPSYGETTYRHEQQRRESHAAPLHLTVPRSPRLLTTERSFMKRRPELTTEEMQLLELQEENERLHKRRKVMEQQMLKAFAAQHYPERSARELTQPEEFYFHTEDRIRFRHQDEEPEEQPQPRRTRPTYNSLTVPQPFHFQSQERILQKYGDNIPQPSEYKTLTEQTMNFHMGTRSPQSKRNQRTQKRAHRPLQPTVPQPFHLETNDRAYMKPKEHTLTSEERELLELESVPKFRARPLNKKVFEFQEPERYEVPLTDPAPFHFATDYRLGPKEVISKRVVEPPSMRGTFNFSDSLSSTRISGPTVPQSPNLHTKQRAYGKQSLQQTEEEKRQKQMKETQFKAKPAPHNVPFRLKPAAAALTDPEPFNLKTEVRGSEWERRLAEQLEKERREEEESRIFKARPLPSFEAPMVGGYEDGAQTHPYGTLKLPPSNLALTEPEPFRLRSEQRGQAAAEQFKILVDEEIKREKQARQFKAKPFVLKPAFEPEKSTRALTELNEIILNSDRRAVKRQAWENEKMQKEIAYHEAKRQLEEEQRERDAKELENYRRSLVPHAQPFKKLKPFEPRPADKVLTEPQSPALRTKVRYAMRDL